MAEEWQVPPPLDIDWKDARFKVTEVNGHIESYYSKSIGKWSDPVFVRDSHIRIHGMALALNYGQQCYEGLKARRTPGDKHIQIFRPQFNAERMQHSASAVSIPEVPQEHFLHCVRLAVGLNAEWVPSHDSGSSLYIRPLLLGSGAQLGLDAPDEYMFLVYVVPTGAYHGGKAADALILEDFDRVAPEGTGSAKVGGNYAPVLKHSKKAKEDGYQITLHLDSKTRSEIDEFSTSGFIGLRKTPNNEITLVIPDSKTAINSVTSDSVRRIAESFGWKVEKRRVPYEELGSFSEVIAAGTGAVLLPIKSITCKSKDKKFIYLEGEEGGPLHAELLAKLKGIQRGEIEDVWGWCDRVQKPILK